MLTRNNVTLSVVPPSQQTTTSQAGMVGLHHRSTVPAGTMQKQIEFKQMCFYFDQIDQVTLTKYSAFIVKFGGRIVPGIDGDGDGVDVNQKSEITHIISERHSSRKMYDGMQRKCILRPRKPSAQEIMQYDSMLNGSNCNTPSNPTLPSITSAITTNLSLDSASNIHIGSQAALTASQQIGSTGPLNFALFTPVTSNINSASSSMPFFPSITPYKPGNSSCHFQSIKSQISDENSNNGASMEIPSLQKDTSSLPPKKQFDILQYAQQKGIVVWTKDELRACLLTELKRYESTKASKSLWTSATPNEPKGLAEYLAEERKLGGTNRNAVTNINISTSATAKKMLKCDELSVKGSASGTKAAAFVPQPYSPALPYLNGSYSLNINTSTYHVFKFPFILIEDTSQECKPIFKEYSGEEKSKVPVGSKAKKSTQTPSILPKFNLKAGQFVCPFLAGYSSCSGVATHSKPLPPPPIQKEGHDNSSRTLKMIIEEKCRKRKLTMIKSAKQKGKPGFCECCYEVYTDLEKHSKTSAHRSFALCDKNYLEIDNLLSDIQRPVQLITPQSPKSPSLAHKQQQQQQQQITSSLLIAPAMNCSDEMQCSVLNPGQETGTDCYAGGCGIQSLDDTECTFVNSELLKSPCVRAKRCRSDAPPFPHILDPHHPHQHRKLSFRAWWDLTGGGGGGLDENTNRNGDGVSQEPKVKRQKQYHQSLSSSRSTEIVGKIHSLLQVISSNAERREDDLTVHELK